MSPTRRPWAEPENEQDAPEEPFLKVVRGEPTLEELAALTAVLATTASAPVEEEAQEATRTDVLRRTARLRSRLLTVPGAWRSRGR